MDIKHTGPYQALTMTNRRERKNLKHFITCSLLHLSPFWFLLLSACYIAIFETETTTYISTNVQVPACLRGYQNWMHWVLSFLLLLQNTVGIPADRAFALVSLVQPWPVCVMSGCKFLPSVWQLNPCQARPNLARKATSLTRACVLAHSALKSLGPDKLQLPGRWDTSIARQPVWPSCSLSC